MSEIKITNGKGETINTLEHHGEWAKVTSFMVVGPGVYGYGKDPATAKKNAKAQGTGKGKGDKFLLFAGDDSLGITGWGQVTANVCLFQLGEI